MARASASGSSRGLFIGQRKDQLGARLLMMSNCLRLSHQFDTSYAIDWFPKGNLAPHLDAPEDIFSEDYLSGHFRTGPEIAAMLHGAKPIWAFLKDRDPDGLLAHLASGMNILVDEGFEVVCFPWENEDEVRQGYAAHIRQIGFNGFIRDRMALIDTALGDVSGLTAYHIRRGDILNERPWRDGMWPAKIEPDELYDAHLAKAIREDALVFSDQPESAAGLRSRWPSVRALADILDLGDCKPVQRDVLELYAMSRAERIVAPVISAFSSAAARLSGKQRLRFVDVLETPEIDAAFDKLAARYENPEEAFVNLSEAAQLYARLARHLAVNDREEEAYRISDRLRSLGADNAFLALLHAINCTYLGHWEEAQTAILEALENPRLWKQDHAVARALLACIAGALGDTEGAAQEMACAFWTKPLAPDVTILFSALLEKDWLDWNSSLPVDCEALRAVRIPYSQRNVLTVQKKFLRRRAVDTAVMVYEWPDFVLDRKSRRLLSDKPRAAEIRSHIGKTKGVPGEFPRRDSFRGLLQSYAGEIDSALALTNAAFEAAPEDFFVAKRRIEVLWRADLRRKAFEQAEAFLGRFPLNPFAAFLAAKLHLAADNRETSLPLLRTASELDRCTAAIHATLAETAETCGRLEEARAAYDRAAEIAPRHDAFGNRRDRIARKLKMAARAEKASAGN